MKGKIDKWKVIALLGTLLFQTNLALAQKGDCDSIDSPRIIHSLGIEVRPDYVFPTNDFLKKYNQTYHPFQQSLSGHLKYSFRFHPNSLPERIYGGVYQGIGVAGFTFGERYQLGNPVAFYLFQGGRIAQFCPRLSLNYEWNFGVSTGWKHYDPIDHRENPTIGSTVNAYMNVNVYLNWMLSRHFDLIAGGNISHFSNGNTQIPNAGLNTTGLKVGLAYYFNRQDNMFSKPGEQSYIPRFPRHISYDLTLFGSWRRKGIDLGDEKIPSPNAYTVLGVNFAPMYNMGYRLRAGLSLDAVYDESANIRVPEYTDGSYSPSREFIKPPVSNRFALGLSGRVEYVMPFFTIGFGMGANLLYAGEELKGLYQVLTLKMEVTRSSYIHIGYNLQNFHEPNYLMIGIGYRFHNKYPTFYR